MKIEELLMVIGDRNVIVRQHKDATDDVILVSDPLKFITLMGVEEGWATIRKTPTNGKTPPSVSKRPTDAHRKAVSKGVSRYWARVRAGEIPNPRSKPPRPVESATRLIKTEHSSGRRAPRLGSLHITEEDANRAREAVMKRDGALSPLELSVLRYRLGAGNQPPLKITEIQRLLSLRSHTQVSLITRRALRILGVKRHGRRKGWKRRAEEGAVHA